MRPEARPIEFTNGRAHFYGKKKVDRWDYLGWTKKYIHVGLYLGWTDSLERTGLFDIWESEPFGMTDSLGRFIY